MPSFPIEEVLLGSHCPARNDISQPFYGEEAIQLSSDGCNKGGSDVHNIPAPILSLSYCLMVNVNFRVTLEAPH